MSEASIDVKKVIDIFANVLVGGLSHYLREGYLKAGAKHLLAELPVRVLNKIEDLSKRTGKNAHEIVEKGILLFERSLRKPETDLSTANEKLASIRQDPKKRVVFDEIMSTIRSLSDLSMTPAQKQARAKAGGEARAKNLTDEQRREIAKKAASKRWSTDKENT